MDRLQILWFHVGRGRVVRVVVVFEMDDDDDGDDGDIRVVFRS